MVMYDAVFPADCLYGHGRHPLIITIIIIFPFIFSAFLIEISNHPSPSEQSSTVYIYRCQIQGA